MRALDYDMNSVEWAIADGVPYAIDFARIPRPIWTSTHSPHYFDWVVGEMATMAIKMAKSRDRQVEKTRWHQFFGGQ